jgi:hypothetical protein
MNDIHETLRKLINHMSFDGIEDIEYVLTETDLSEEERTELISEIGEIIFVDFNSRKDGRNCIETRVVHFPKFDTYIKEVQVGTCHYKDVNIDGGYDEVEYSVVRPVEKTSLSFE